MRNCRFHFCSTPGATYSWLGRLTAIFIIAIPTASRSEGAEQESQAAFAREIRPFLNNHCVRCHGPEQAKAGFRVDELSADFHAPKAAEAWQEVMDKINLGEMPPEDEPSPMPAEFEPVVVWINAKLREEELAASNAGGRIPMRRLNRVEFANSVRDLLHIDSRKLAPLVEELPGDGKAEGFDRLGVALFFDQTQIERTLGVAEKIAAVAIVEDAPETHSQRAEVEANPRVKPSAQAKNPFGGKTMIEPGPAGFEHVNGGVRFVHGYGNRPKGENLGRVAQTDCEGVVVQDGYYRIRILAGADPGSRGEPIRVKVRYGIQTPVEEEFEITVEAPLDAPQVHEAIVFLRSGPEGLRRSLGFQFNDIPDLIQASPENNRLNRAIRGAIDKLRDAKTSGAAPDAVATLTAELEKVQAEGQAWKGPLREYRPDRDSKNPPTLFLDWVEISGPVVSEWPPQSHRTIFFDGDERQDAAYFREIFARFLPRAYRRPVAAAEIDGVAQFVEQAQRDGATFHDAMRLGLARVLSSPGFLFIQEPVLEDAKPRKLNDYELASRLSYFLWSSMPDDELFTLAAGGGLSNPQTLSQQVDRMLADPKSEAFVEGFAGQWLQVREFGSVMPAAEYQRNYDKELEEASRQEVYAFFREVLANDLPVTNFLDSDFVMVNERLARHYGIDGIAGTEIRRVAIEPQVHRGGVLGMAGLMTLLSDGTRTLPVRRAAWVKTQLFGDPPGNPPPNAGEIQPNASGKNLTVRQRLDLHRNEPTCASCHTKLDPFGLALENYDAIGQWRTKANGEGIRERNAPPIDISTAFPEGDAISSLEQYKAGLIKRQDQFANNLATQVLTYALTRPIGYADRQTVDKITTTLRQDDYRFRSLIRAVVSSELFQTK